MCVAASIGGLALLAGCHIDMWRQPHQVPQSESDFFADHAAMRVPPEHTVARGELRTDDAYYTGFVNGRMVTTIPDAAVNSFKGDTPQQRMTAMLRRGQDRFDIFCSPCHSRLGNGEGMIAQRGLALRRQPGNYHTARLIKMPVGHFFDVITNGYGVMYSYAARVQDVNDRWAIVAYIRALQLSENARQADLTPEDMTRWQRQNAPKPEGGEGHE